MRIKGKYTLYRLKPVRSPGSLTESAWKIKDTRQLWSQLAAPEYFEQSRRERRGKLMLVINMVANQLFPNFLSLAFVSVLTHDATYNLGKISYQAIISDIYTTNTICSGYTW